MDALIIFLKCYKADVMQAEHVLANVTHCGSGIARFCGCVLVGPLVHVKVRRSHLGHNTSVPLWVSQSSF
jgi:hypothetical protein